MTNNYWTHELSASGGIAEGAVLQWEKDEATARVVCLSQYVAGLDGLEIDERVDVVQIEPGDCWLKLPAKWSRERVEEHCEKMGACGGDIVIIPPHQHPGQENHQWVNVCGNVWGPAIVRDEQPDAAPAEEPEKVLWEVEAAVTSLDVWKANVRVLAATAEEAEELAQFPHNFHDIEWVKSVESAGYDPDSIAAVEKGTAMRVYKLDAKAEQEAQDQAAAMIADHEELMDL